MEEFFAPTTSLFVILGGSMILGGVIAWAVFRYQDWRHKVQQSNFSATPPRLDRQSRAERRLRLRRN